MKHATSEWYAENKSHNSVYNFAELLPFVFFSLKIIYSETVQGIFMKLGTENKIITTSKFLQNYAL